MTTGDDSILTQRREAVRSAYLAGDVRTLIDALDEAQQEQFRIHCIRQGVHLAESVMRFEEGMPELRALRAIRQWAEQPDPDHIPEISDILNHPLPGESEAVQNGKISLQGIVVSHYLGQAMANPSAPAAAGKALGSLVFGIQDVDPHRRARAVAAVESAKRWQLDAAWALYEGMEPPPLPEFAS